MPEKIDIEPDDDGFEKIYSYSMLKNFENCRRSFYRRYVMREEVLAQTAEAYVGTITHETLQRMFMEKKNGRMHTKEEICKILGGSKQIISYHMRNLEADGMIKTEKYGLTKKCYLRRS